MHRSRLAQIIIDCGGVDLDDAATFWAAALGMPSRRLKDPADAHYRQLDTEEGQPCILLQSVDHPVACTWTWKPPTWRPKCVAWKRSARGASRRCAPGG